VATVALRAVRRDRYIVVAVDGRTRTDVGAIERTGPAGWTAFDGRGPIGMWPEREPAAEELLIRAGFTVDPK
jgi:hypothetical protein